MQIIKSIFVLSSFFVFSCQFAQKSEKTNTFNKKDSIQKSIIGRWTKLHLEALTKKGSVSYNLMEISREFDALLAMYEYSDSIYYMEDAFSFTEELISITEKGRLIKGNPAIYKDKYKGWVNINKNFKEQRNSGPNKKEIVLFESYFLRYVAKMLYMANKNNLIKKSEIIASSYSPILKFVEEHGWEKWYNRGLKEGCYRYLFRNRTHMTSHWAIVALYLREIGKDQEQYSQYDSLLYMYDHQLRLNLKVTKKGAYKWNMTWDHNWPYGLNCNPPATKPIVQDVSHGNHVIAYVVEAYDMKHEWDRSDIQRFIKTVKTILYNEKEHRFYTNLAKEKGKRYTKGIRMADGFLKLARYDKELLDVFAKVRKYNEKSAKFNYSKAQYTAQFKLAEKYLGISKSSSKKN